MPTGIYIRSIEHRKNLSLSKMGNTNGFKKGEKKPPFSEEHKAKLAVTGFKKGHKTWNKGKKGILIGPNKGKKFSKEWREKLSKSHVGLMVKEKNVNWKGGITPIVQQIRKSFEMKQWRKAVFERDDYRCIGCGIKSGEGKAIILQADHILPFAQFPRLRFDLNNGRTLCVSCHQQTDTYMGRMRKFSLEGRPIIHLTL